MRRSRSATAAGVAWLLAALGAEAGAVEVRPVDVPRVVFDDEGVRLTFDLVDLDEDVTALELTAPGLQVDGPQSGGRRTQIVNGQRTESARVFWTIARLPQGTHPLGPVRLTTRSGKVVTLPLRPLRVLRRAQGDAVLLRVEAPRAGPVGFPFRVVYTLLTARPRDEGGREGLFDLVSGGGTFGLTRLGVPLFEGQTRFAPVVPDPALPASGLTVGAELTLQVQSGLEEHEGLGYHAVRFALEVVPRKPGDLDLSAEAGVKVVSGTRRVRDLFGRVREVPASVEVTASTGPVTYAVEPLPAAGRPAAFTGAVGRYAVEAQVEETRVNAYDPIEVTVTVRGEGLIEDVVLPDWQALEEIAREFEVASDVDPGRLIEDGRAKVFTKVFRAKSPAVRGLPALPFPYYDPRTRGYEVARTAPIPLEVVAVETVTAADALGGAPAASAEDGGAAPTAIAARQGIAANYVDLGPAADALAPPARLDALLLLVLLAPPLALAGALLGPRARAALARPPSPLEAALDALGDDLDAVRGAFAGYFTARLELAGEVTSAELEQALRARAVAPQVVARAVEHWHALERARFAGGGEPPTGSAALLREVDACL